MSTPKLPPHIQAQAEAAVHKFVNECPKYSGYPAHMETYLAAWADCYAHLLKSAPEFDEAALYDNAKLYANTAIDQYRAGKTKETTRYHGLRSAFVKGARWQHAQGAAQGAALRASGQELTDIHMETERRLFLAQKEIERQTAMAEKLAGALEAIISGEGGDPDRCQALAEWAKFKHAVAATGGETPQSGSGVKEGK